MIDADQDRRFTLPATLDLCKALARVDRFDLDVAAEAGHSCADAFIDADADGLASEWAGRVWCNPPFSDCGAWVRKAHEQVAKKSVILVAMLLPATRTEQVWWQVSVQPWLVMSRHSSGVEISANFLPGRTKFGTPDDPTADRQGSPKGGCVLLVFRPFTVDRRTGAEFFRDEKARQQFARRHPDAIFETSGDSDRG